MSPLSTWIDFRRIRETVTLERVIDHYGVELRRINPATLRGKCPLPSHTSKSAYSFIVNRQRNLWVCHSQSCAAARAGRKGGNVLDFVSTMENCSLREAAMKITRWFSVPGESTPIGMQPQSRPAKTDDTVIANPPLRFTLRGIDPTHTYLVSRGISAETAATFGIGYYGQPGTMNGRVVIPIHNENGELVAYAGRAIDGTEPKYRFPMGFRKSGELFNLHRAVATRTRQLIVVEGYFDCMMIHQAGISHVVALMGSTLSSSQEELLVRHADEVILMLDGDRAGCEATERITGQLAGKVSLSVIRVPEGKQPDQMTKAELRNLLVSTARPKQERRSDPEQGNPVCREHHL
jgi:DNA primase